MLIYNTLSKEKELFKTLHPNQVKLYVCGPTVYDYCHVGHARVYLVFDTMVRYFQYLGFTINYVRNITDIDDKIIKRAIENNESIGSLTTRFIAAMHEDFKALHILPPTIEPRATEYIQPMVDMIQTLIDKNYAYVAENGDVYYNVRHFTSYGCLAQRDLEDLQVGARVEVNEAKHNPLDFVLWKKAKSGEPSWPSPWGQGRPGWHIECSAMGLQNLGETFDIHGGGLDLKFPHHENERAQSEAATGKKFVHYWMHIGFVQIEKEKMAKSLGNCITIRDFLAHHHPEVLRYFSLSSHYRSSMDYANHHLDSAFKGLERFYMALQGIPNLSTTTASENTDFERRFIEAMNDDFNTPEAIAVLFDLVRKMNKIRENDLNAAAQLGALLKKLAGILGILQDAPEVFLQNVIGKGITLAEIETLIAERNAAREAKDWGRADEIRKQLEQSGIALKDVAGGGTTWYRSGCRY